MSRKFEELKEKYFIEHDYIDRIFLDIEEEKIIKNMNNKSMKQYIRDNKIYQDTDTMSQTSTKYFRIKLWDITNEEFPLIMQIESNSKISKIHFILSFFFITWIIGVVLFLVSAMIN